MFFYRKIFFILFTLISNTSFAQEVFVDMDQKTVYSNRYNDIKIILEGFPCNKTYVKAFFADGEFSGDACNYKLLLRNCNAVLKVYKLTEKDTVFIKDIVIKSMSLPKHKALCAGKTSGAISLDLLKKVSGLRGVVGDWKLYGCIKFKVSTYHVLVMRGDELIYSESCKSNVFSKAFKKSLEKTRKNDKVYFLSIDIINSNGELYRTDPITLQIQ